MDLTNRVLNKRSRPYDFRFPSRNQSIADAMLWIMHRSQGIGLAAPQVGIGRRLFVMDVDGHVRLCFNPQIKWISSDSIKMVEGCLSFPGDACTIKRPAKISVIYHDANGAAVLADLFGIEARCFQHELDHLDGVTMWDRYKEQNAEQS